MSQRRLVVLGLLLGISLVGCRREASPPAGARHPLRGRAVSVDAARRAITIAHEDVPGFMPAMTMEFVVLEKDAPLLDRVSPGDQITATLVVPDSRYWLEDLVVVKKAEGPLAMPSHAPAARVGESLPDVPLVDQDGRAFRLSQLQGRAYALTFVYTRCPLPDFCPLMMRNFTAAETLLAADAALLARTRLLTVSFDPKHDTPAVLRAFGKPFQKARPPFGHWWLATGRDEAIRVLGTALELDYLEEEASFTHNLRTAVVDPRGRLVRLLRGNEWKPEELVAALREAARQ